jgi:KipI family sensor histidine kinase inhibitor
MARAERFDVRHVFRYLTFFIQQVDAIDMPTQAATLIQPTLAPLGDNALVCSFAPPATLATQTRVWSVARAARAWPHVTDVIPGMNNLTLVFNPMQADTRALCAQLTRAWQNTDANDASGNLVEIPVHYGGENGPDLEEIARHTGLSPEEVIARHTVADYVVFFLGFQPGFAYLGGLDPRLATPRRAEPRLAVPIGSVGIGGEQTGIYPAESPGGWQLLGRTPLKLFDPARPAPSLLAPGDRVRFTVAGGQS